MKESIFLNLGLIFDTINADLREKKKTLLYALNVSAFRNHRRKNVLPNSYSSAHNLAKT